jgi:polyphenol oxidase
MLASDADLLVVWPAKRHIRALMTTRAGGVSQGDYASLNLGLHVSDDKQAVMHNRTLLAQTTNAKLRFLKQVHGNAVADLDDENFVEETPADACVSSQAGIACVVMVADCLPVLFTNTQGTVVAAAHCGWKGLSGVENGGVGVLETTMLAARAKEAVIRSQGALVNNPLTPTLSREGRGGKNLDEWMAWLGPAIGPQHFEVGPEVREAFVRVAAEDARAFTTAANGKYMANLFALARMRLGRLGVSQVFGGGDNTYAQPERYFSHRRATHEGKPTGRQAALVWIAP